MSRMRWSRFCYAWCRIGIAASVSRSWKAPSLAALEEVVRINEMCAPMLRSRRVAA
jgi:hypothetical protein